MRNIQLEIVYNFKVIIYFKIYYKYIIIREDHYKNYL